MKYNTTREHLKISEYGRHIQKMTNHILSIEDKEKRTKMAYAIVSIMEQMIGFKKETTGDVKHKLWDHLHIISDMKLDVNAPYELPTPTESQPEKISYPEHNMKYRYYGKNTEKMVEKIGEMEDSPERNILIGLVANHLKKQYLHWNKSAVEDETVFAHLSELSSDKIKITDDINLNATEKILSQTKRKKHISKKSFSGRKENRNGKYKKRY